MSIERSGHQKMFFQDTTPATPDSTLLSLDAIVNSLLGTMGVIVLVVTFVGITWRLLLREPLVAVVRSGLDAALQGKITAAATTAGANAAKTVATQTAQTAANSVAQTAAKAAADSAANTVAKTAAHAAVKTAAKAIAQTTAQAAADATAEKAVNDLQQIQRQLSNQDLKLKTIADHIDELLERVPPVAR